MDNPLLQAWQMNNNSNHKHTHTIREKFHIKNNEVCVKKEQNPLNNFMKNKTIFESLVEQVMSDDELDVIGAGTNDDVDVEETSETTEESSDVTVTLTADQVECLRGILDQIDGSGVDEELEDETTEDFSEEDSGDIEEAEDEEFDAFANEAVEAEEVGTPLVNQKKGNPSKPTAGSNKVAGRVTSMAKAGKAVSTVTDKVGNDGDEGTPLVNQKKGNPKKPTSGDNKVAGRASNVGADLFA